MIPLPRRARHLRSLVSATAGGDARSIPQLMTASVTYFKTRMDDNDVEAVAQALAVEDDLPWALIREQPISLFDGGVQASPLGEGGAHLELAGHLPARTVGGVMGVNRKAETGRLNDLARREPQELGATRSSPNSPTIKGARIMTPVPQAPRPSPV